MNNKQEYLNPRCDRSNLDSFLIRNGILKALEAVLPSFIGKVLDVGCGFKPYRSIVLSSDCKADEYIGLDFSDGLYGAPDLAWDGLSIPLAEHSIDTAMATEVLEHCPDPGAVLKEICRVLKPGGVFFFTVPFLWPLHDMPHDYYRYTPRGLEELLLKNGFSGIEVFPLGGWDASLAQILGLWVSRRPMPVPVRTVLQTLLWPVYRLLLYVDKKNEVLGSDTIFPGLYGVARKQEAEV